MKNLAPFCRRNLQGVTVTRSGFGAERKKRSPNGSMTGSDG